MVNRNLDFQYFKKKKKLQKTLKKTLSLLSPTNIFRTGTLLLFKMKRVEKIFKNLAYKIQLPFSTQKKYHEAARGKLGTFGMLQYYSGGIHTNFSG